MDAPLDLPANVAMFPLPNVVLFPGQALPLHIFEERYKQMMRHVMSQDRPLIGMQLYRKGWEKDKEFPPTYAMGCLGRVGEVQTLPDGRYNMILHGLARVEVVEYEQRTPFRIAQVRQMHSTAPADADFEELLMMLAVSIRKVLPVVSRSLTWEDVRPILEQLPGPAAVSDFVAAHLPTEAHVRQELLETLDVELRLRRILDILAGLLSVLN